MNVKIKYFGAVADKTRVSEELIQFDKEMLTLSDVRSFCENKYQDIQQLKFNLSINMNLKDEGEIVDGDEIAFLPPFAGG